MKKTINLIFIFLCLLVFFYKYEIITAYLSYKYPSPAIFSGLTVPIAKGDIYDSSKNSINISNPLNDSYVIRITEQSSLDSGNELAEYLEQLGHNLIEIETVENRNEKYIKATSIDRRWLFNVFIYFSERNILISYRGSKKNYPKFKKIITENWGDIPIFNESKKLCKMENKRGQPTIYRPIANAAKRNVAQGNLYLTK